MANAHEHLLQYPLGPTLPERGSTLEIAPGVRWLRMGLPFALDHINLWLLRDRDDEGREGWTVVDCGIADDATRAAWESVFAEALEGLPVLRVVVTHMHPDHIGLAHWLCARWSEPGHECRMWISATDWGAARMASATSGSVGGDSAAEFFARHGLVDPASLAAVRERRGYYAHLVPQVPARMRRLMDGMTLRIGARNWTCIAGYGHAPEHIALAADGLLISGDMVLPSISTNVSVMDFEPESDPLSLYLSSIDRYRPLAPDTLVLPSHGRPFRGLHARIDQLHAHHEERYAAVLAACAEGPKCAADLLPVLFRRRLDLHQTTFAIGEAVAHLHALAASGRLRRLQPEDAEHGVWRFERVEAGAGVVGN
ncbi:MAG: MBL fold metallo-hydrolase [Burkholderiales bacterium]|nr:MBL fold metallo-hydrolase [Burkholderiales bacterium]MDE2456748.1 MBL fold metallo-hydrolase [Burkholderiales bacterium]